MLCFHFLCSIYVRTQAQDAFSLSYTVSLNISFSINTHPSLFLIVFSFFTSHWCYSCLDLTFCLLKLSSCCKLTVLPVLLLRLIILLPKSYKGRPENVMQSKLTKQPILSKFSALKPWNALGTLVLLTWFYADRSMFWAVDSCTSDILNSTKEGNKLKFSRWGTGYHRTKLGRFTHNLRGSLLDLF